MCRGGIQDRINPYHDPITVRTDPEEPLMVKDLRDYWTNAQRICWTEQRHVEELRRLLVQCEETCEKLVNWHEVCIAPQAPYVSVAFDDTLFDSYGEIHRAASAIKHILTHNEDLPPFPLDVIWHTQYLLDVAAEKLAFVEDLDKLMQRQRRALARLQPIIKDKVTNFYIALACDKPAL